MLLDSGIDEKISIKLEDFELELTKNAFACHSERPTEAKSPS